MKNTQYLLLCFLFLLSCSDNDLKDKQVIDYIKINSINSEAIKFYRDAKLNLFNGELIEAKQAFLSAIKIDPNFFLANLEINEDNIKIKETFNNIARKGLETANDYEKRFYDYKTSPSRFDKRKIAKGIVENYPNNFEGYILEGLTHYWWTFDTQKAQDLFKKAIAIDPDNLIANYQYLNYKYNGAPTAFKLRNDVLFYENFDKEATDLVKKFPNNITVLSGMGLIYRNSIIDKDVSRFEKSKSLYEKALKIADANNSSTKVQLTKDLGDLFVMSGQNKDGIEAIKRAIDLSEDNNQNIRSNFALFNAYIYMGDYLNAIKSIDNFIGSINGYGFSEEEKLRCYVATNHYKSIIYAHANQKERAEQSLAEYKEYSDKLISFYGWERSEAGEILSRTGRGRNDNIRWTQLTPAWQLRNEIWIDILVGNYQEASNLLEEAKIKFNAKWTDYSAILDIMQGKMIEGIEKLDKNNARYPLYFKAQALQNIGQIDRSIQILDSIRFLPIQNFYNALVVKRASNLYKQISK